jgi:predicted aspartyl protease
VTLQTCIGSRHAGRRRLARAVCGLFATLLALGAAGDRARAINLPAAQPAAPEAFVPEELAEITVQGRGPRFVAPTNRDQIGRIWAPVVINGLGPFRLVLDTGASHSGITPIVALVLGIATNVAPPVMLRGVTGGTVVPTIRVDSLRVGDLAVRAQILPVMPDAFGGAEGVLGFEGLADKRVLIDFRRDLLSITFSRGERSPRGFVTLPFRSIGGQLIVIDANIGGVATKAIIDTGGEATIANLALEKALAQRRQQPPATPDEIVGVSLDAERGQLMATPPIELGGVRILGSRATFVDVNIFKQWKLTREPAVLIGMDVLGLLDTLIIDYRRHELQLRMAADP